MNKIHDLSLIIPIYWLLIFVPIAMLLRFWHGGISPTALFVCSALGIIPVAGWIGRATEALACRVGEGLGGLLNATFGNAAELIIGGIALSKGLTNVVKASITGSIIGNVLLVLGLSILFGGTKYKEQRFSGTAARTSVVSLSLAAIGLIIPTVFHRAADRSPTGWSPWVEQKLSLAIAVVLFLTYFCMSFCTRYALYAMLAMNAAPGIATRCIGRRGLMAQINSAVKRNRRIDASIGAKRWR